MVESCTPQETIFSGNTIFTRSLFVNLLFLWDWCSICRQVNCSRPGVNVKFTKCTRVCRRHRQRHVLNQAKQIIGETLGIKVTHTRRYPYFKPPIAISTRRFCLRPSSVSLLATGLAGPYQNKMTRSGSIRLCSRISSLHLVPLPAKVSDCTLQHR